MTFQKYILILVIYFFVGLIQAQPAQKNTYYSKWKNGVSSNENFFPIAVWFQPLSRAGLYKSAGINIYISPGITSNSHLSTLKNAGIKAIVNQTSTMLNASNQDVIIGWKQQDEPDNDQNGKGCIEPSVIQGKYNAWTAADPTRPIYLNFGLGASFTNWGGRGSCSGQTDMYPEYSKGADIVSFDIYPVVSKDPIIAGNLSYVPRGIDNIRKWSDYKKPAWCWIECTHINNPSVIPTPDQIKSEVWMALIHEAGGIGYFCHEWYPSFSESAWLYRYPNIKSAITKINKEITSLARVLNSPTVHDQLEAQVFNIAKISTMVKVYGGSTYLFAAYKNKWTGITKFIFTGLPATATVTVLSENRTIPLINGEFSDNFVEYGHHLYRINAPLAIGDSPQKFESELKRNIEIIPNPALGNMNLYLGPGIAGQSVSAFIYNLKGKLINQIEPNKTSQMIMWGGKDLMNKLVPQGLYLVKIKSSKAEITKQFFLMH